MNIPSFGAKPIISQSKSDIWDNSKSISAAIITAGTITQSIQDKLDLNDSVKKTIAKTPEFIEEVACKNKQILRKCVAGLSAAVAAYAIFDYLGLRTKRNQEQPKVNND
ncbi:MAG: hypothetical protein WCK67_01010 [bacterium]